MTMEFKGHRIDWIFVRCQDSRGGVPRHIG